MIQAAPIAFDSAALRTAQRPQWRRVVRRGGKWVMRRSFVENFVACPVYSNANSVEARRGELHHDAFQAYIEECRRQHEHSLMAETDRIAREVFFTKPRGLGPADLADAKRLLRKFAHDWPTELDTLRRLETTMAYDIGWAILTGRFDREDRVDRGDPDDPPTVVRLRDYKTGWGVTDHDFQMRFYAVLRFAEPGAEDLEEVQLEVLYPRRNIDIIQDYWTRDDLEDGVLGEWWREEVLRPLTETWPRRRQLGPSGGVACQYCAKRFTCAAADLVASQTPETDEEFEEHFGVTLRLSELMRERREVLRGFWGNRDPGVMLGHEVGQLVPRDEETLEIAPGREEDVVAYMNKVSPGAGDLIRRSGVNPKLISPAWWDTLVEEGMAFRQPKDARSGWRKVAKKAPPDDDLAAAQQDWDEVYGGPDDSMVRVV